MRWIAVAAATLALSSTAVAQDADRTVKDGGVKVEGWKGRIDRRAMAAGRTVNDSKLTGSGKALRISAGSAGNFWSDANTAAGDYAVSASFKEHKMVATHPHSYGVFIGGADLESETETLMYCIAYGDGKYSIKTFHGAKVTTLVDRAESAALKKADANGESTNEIGWSVKGGKASCMINGLAVKTVEGAEALGAEKLKSFDGTYGVRVAHNVELTVTNLTKKGN